VFGILLVLLLQLMPIGVWLLLMSQLPFKWPQALDGSPLARTRSPTEPAVLLQIERRPWRRDRGQ
jgi:hypothetical protein